MRFQQPACLFWSCVVFEEKLFFWRVIDDVLAFRADAMDDVGDALTYTATVDHDVSRMENLLDQWTTDLKTNVMVIGNPCMWLVASGYFTCKIILMCFILYLLFYCNGSSSRVVPVCIKFSIYVHNFVILYVVRRSCID